MGNKMKNDNENALQREFDEHISHDKNPRDFYKLIPFINEMILF